MFPNGVSGDPVRSLLAPDDPHPVNIVNQDGASSFLLIGDHAGNLIPKRLGTLGLPDAERKRHIAWDIGIAGLGATLATALDAIFVAQRYSRLVIDCNRSPGAPDAIPEVSDGTTVAGNTGLDPNDRSARVAAIHELYQAAIGDLIAARDAAGQDSILVALHSFTPQMAGTARPWEIGILHDGGDPAFALAVLAALRQNAALTVGDNEPYRMDLIDYTIPRHAYPARRRYVEVEIRQDLLETPEWQARWTATLAEALRTAAGSA